MDNNNQKTDIKKAIWDTVAFFDIFDFPLTEFELWQFLPLKCDLAGLLRSLEGISELEKKSGFYFLANRSEIVKIRQRRYNYGDKKFKKTLKVIYLFKFIPWIKMIAIGNIIGPHNLKKESDIDLFIISEKNRVWATRFICVLITEIFRLRPRQNCFKDKICLSFFVDEENMALEKMHLNNIKYDIYFTYWLANLAPIFERRGAYQALVEENQWLVKKLPNWQPVNLVDFRQKISFSKEHFKICNYFYDKLEIILKAVSLKMMNQDLKRCQKETANVIINDGVLKLHIKDRRQEIYNLWQKKTKW